MLGNDFGTDATGFLAAIPACACASIVGTLALITASGIRSESARLNACPSPASSSEGCTLDMLVFYYDENDRLQCDCLDDPVEDDWYLAHDLM